LILDLELPRMSGLHLQREIAGGDASAIVFVTGHGDVPSSVRAMKAGAIEFMLKTFDDQELLRAIDTAIAQDRDTPAFERYAKCERPRSSARSASWCRKSVGHRRKCGRQFEFVPSLIQRPSEKKIPSIQLDSCDGSSTSDNGTVPLSPMMRALTSSR
jgi:DNA-binding response OmpR family regulator